MPRTARAVAVDYPHHITQRGNNREPVFSDDQDRQTYLALLKHYTQKYKISIWAYCLMPNHIHLLAVPHVNRGRFSFTLV
jgi:putative transposase